MFKFMNFKTFLKVTCIAARLSGFFFISIDFKTFTIKKDWLTKLLFVLSCCHSVYSLTFNGHLPIGGISGSKVMEFLVNFLLAAVIFSSSFFKLSNFFYNRRIFKVFADLQWCSDKIEDLSRNSFRKLELLLATSLIVTYNIFYFLISSWYRKLFDVLGIMKTLSAKNLFIVATNTTMFIQFNIFLCMILLSGCLVMSSLNNAARKCLKDAWPVRRKSSPVFVIRRCSLIYAKLCDVYENISRVFVKINLVFVACYMIYAIIFLYSLFIFQKKPSERMFYFCQMTFTWVIVYTPTVTIVFAASSKVLSQSKVLANIVQEVACQSKDREVLRLSRSFGLMVEHRKPIMSCALYNLGWPTCFMLMERTFSYSIIIFQFYDVSK